MVGKGEGLFMDVILVNGYQVFIVNYMNMNINKK